MMLHEIYSDRNNYVRRARNAKFYADASVKAGDTTHAEFWRHGLRNEIRNARACNRLIVARLKSLRIVNRKAAEKLKADNRARSTH